MEDPSTSLSAIAVSLESPDTTASASVVESVLGATEVEVELAAVTEASPEAVEGVEDTGGAVLARSA